MSTKPDECCSQRAQRAGDLADAHLSYRNTLVRLMSAQAGVLYGCSAILLLSENCPSSFKFLPGARAVSIAGLLTQLAFHRGASPSKLLAAISTEDSRLRTTVFFASLWLPFMPFVVSVLFLCIGIHRESCLLTLFLHDPA